MLQPGCYPGVQTHELFLPLTCDGNWQLWLNQSYLWGSLEALCKGVRDFL